MDSMKAKIKQGIWGLLLVNSFLFVSACGFDDDGSLDLVLSIRIIDDQNQDTNTISQSQTEPVVFILTIENNGDEDVTLTRDVTETTPYDIQIIDEAGDDDEVVFQWSQSNPTDVDTDPLVLEPDDPEHFRIEWDLKENDGGLIDIGTYTVRGFFADHSEDIETNLTIN